jgi:HK97 family phage major capsid protein
VTITQLIEQLNARMADRLRERNANAAQLAALRELEQGGTAVDATEVARLRAANVALDADLDQMTAQRRDLEDERARDEAADRLAREVHPGAGRPAYDRVARVGAQERTYRPDRDRTGAAFAADVAAAFLGNEMSRQRLADHMREEAVERGYDADPRAARAVGTGAFTGLVVPQYLTDMFAPMATAGRPFADAMNRHVLPETGMVVNIGRGTTGTSAALQASEGTALSSTDYDDTLLAIPVQTAGGQQVVSRQGIDRGVNVEDTIMSDLVRRHASVVDSTVINQASTGLSAVATVTAYTDASPTVAENYPKIIEALSKVESSLMDVASGDNLAVMHSRRWYWLNNALVTAWPAMSQPDILEKTLGVNYAERYGNGIRGVLPNGTPVVVDNNIVTNLGAGTNEDEEYLVDRQECHLWEDPNAPLFIRADQPLAANLQVVLVVYSYFAYTHSRYAQAQKIGGTGLVTPTFTGV